MASADNASRTVILGKIASALRAAASAPETPEGTALFRPVCNPLERFRQECTGNLVECAFTSNNAESGDVLAKVLASLPEGAIFFEDAPELKALYGRMQGAGRDVQWSSVGRPSEHVQATVTTAECLVAATGSIVVSSSRGGRCGSVVAPCHIVYATTNQLVPDLESAMKRLYESDAADRNSLVGLVTGSSRTADIEKILVLGAHGPRRVVVIIEQA